eukprot:Skav214907  [mRNA]  locus=scaffold4992:17107:18841:+ [translate_table: standard]
MEPSSSSELKIPKSPVVILMIGMAGSGKSTLMHRMVVRLSRAKKVYTVNLDPAVKNLAYPVMPGRRHQGGEVVVVAS